MKYNEYNTAALNAVGGKTSGLTMTVATMQLGVCAIYALIMWTIKLNPAKIFGLQAPEKQSAPKSTKADLMKSIPLAFCAAGAHAATVFALGGDPLFGQIGKFCLLLFVLYSFLLIDILTHIFDMMIYTYTYIYPVKSAEPVLAAIVGTIFYNKAPSFYKVCCLPIIVGGVAFASLKKGEDGGYSLKFDTTALVFGMLANSFAAFKGGENSKLMSDKGVAQRYGGVGNQVSYCYICHVFAYPNLFLLYEYINLFLL